MAAADIALPMVGDHVDIQAIRKELGLSQRDLARLVGFSVRAIQSCEQGWRQPSAALERSILLLLMSHRNGGRLPERNCWDQVNCNPERCENCITRRTGQGHLCWFLHGTLCSEPTNQEWEEKRVACLKCPFFAELLGTPSA